MQMVRARAAGIGRSDRLPRRLVMFLPDSRRRSPQYMPALKALADGSDVRAFCPDDDRESLAGLTRDLPRRWSRSGQSQIGAFEAYLPEGRAGTIGCDKKE